MKRHAYALWAALFVIFSVKMATAQTVTTDQSDYAPGSTVVITGTGFAPNETVQLQVLNVTNPTDTGDEHTPWNVTADANGSFTATWLVTEDELNMTLQLTATGLTSHLTANTTFTDSASVSAVSVGTQNGTLTYGTADSVTYTVTVTGSGNGSLTTVSVTSLPTGATFSPTSIGSFKPTANFTLTINTANTTPAGVYTFGIRVVGDGGGAATNTGTLTIGKATSSVAYVGTGPFTYNATAQTPTISFTGSTGTKTTNYVGTGSTSYSSANAPTDAGTYYVTNTVVSDSNFIGATNSQAFTINKASTSVSAGSSLNPSGYKAAVSFTASLPSAATGNVIFATTNAPFSTNALSSGSATSLSITNLPRGTNAIFARYAGDSNYLGSTNSLAVGQIVTNHPPVAASFSVTNSINTFKMTFSDLLTNATDVDGDALACAGFSVSTNGVTIATNATLFQYRNSTNVNDQFNYIVADGFGGSATGAVSVVFNPFGNPPTGQSGTVTPVAGKAHLKYYGIPTYRYGIQRSTNLSTWVTIQTTNAPGNGVFTYDDNFSDLGTPPASAYYRLVWNP